MDDRRVNVLQYGHLGTASYLPEEQVWEFSRHLERGHTLTPLGGVTVSPVENATRRDLRLHQNDDFLLSRKEDLLMDVHPQLASSFGIIGHHEASSQALTENVNKFDPLVSSRFVLGHASVVDGGRVTERTIQIVVSASGLSPTSLRLFPLDSENILRPLDDVVSAEIPVIDYEENALWAGNGGPVQQVVLSEALNEKSVFVAVRLALTIVILRPLYHLSHPRANDTLGHASNSNTLGPNPLIEIPNSVTGFGVYADVSFNPWHQRQLAIVDCVGNWSVWDLQSRQPHKGHWTAEPGPSGSLVTIPGDDFPAKERDHYDGWATISWIRNVHQLLVCDRRTAVVFRTDVYPPERHVIDLQFERLSEWILGTSRSKCNPSHVFIVTSIRVFWLSIASDEQYEGQNERKSSILLSWRHFRDLEDTSLTLTTTLIENETYLVLYSRLNAFAQLFRFSMSPEDSSIPISVSDPSVFLLPRDDHDTDPSSNTAHAIYSCMILKEVEDAVVPKFSGSAETLKIIKFMGQRTDSRMVESLYCTATETKNEFGGFAASDTIIPSKRKGAAFSLSSTRAAADDFIVDDRDTSIVSSHLRTEPGSPRQIGHRSQHLEQWSGHHVSICSAVENALIGKDRPFQSQNFNEWLEFIRDTLQDSAPETEESVTPNTLLDILHEVPAINDIDENSQEFEAVIKGAFGVAWNRFPRRELAYLPLPWSSTSSVSSVYSMETHNIGIAGLYDSLVMDWLSPLSEDVPGKIRVFKERMVRKMLTELVMSRIVIFRDERENDNVFEGSGMKPATPSATSRTSASELNQLSSPPSSFPEALPSEGGSSAPLSSQSLSQSIAEETSASTYPRLCRYTSLNSQGTTPKRVTTTASHWKIGSDPSAYDWQATIRTLQGDEESDARGSQLREKRARRTERKRAQQMERASQPSNASLGVPPAVKIGGSQPEKLQPAPQQTQSSQVEVQIPMSQIVRGPFGNRDVDKKSVAKARKKRRAAGF